MIDQVELEGLQTQIAEAKAESTGRTGTHWDGCWVNHIDCAVALVERLVGALSDAAHRQVVLDRLVVAFEWAAPVGLPSPIDAEMEIELERINKAWGTVR